MGVAKSQEQSHSGSRQTLLGSQLTEGCLGMHPASTQMPVPPGPALGEHNRFQGTPKASLWYSFSLIL